MPVQLKVTTGKENQKTGSVEVFGFWCPRNPHDGTECALSVSTKNPRSGIRKLGAEVKMDATTTGFAVAGLQPSQWIQTNYEIKSGTVLKIYVNRRATTRAGGPAAGIVYLKAREDAPLHELKVPLLMMNNSTLTHATWVGRFDVLVRKEARDLGCKILDHHYEMATQVKLKKLAIELVELEPAIAKEIAHVVTEVKAADGTVKQVRTAWRGRQTKA